MKAMKNVCLFGASCPDMDRTYFEDARLLGSLLARRGFGLVFGGGNTGLMGAAARGFGEAGGHITGVIPEKLNVPGIAYPGCDELIVTPDMHTRKAKMEELSCAYIAMPGGYGTLEELLEVLTLNQLGYISAPVVLLNTLNYFGPLVKQLDDCIEKQFTAQACRGIYSVAADAAEAVQAVSEFVMPELPNKIKDALKRNA